MLEGHIEIGQYLLALCHNGDQSVRYVSRIRVHHPNPGNIRDGVRHLLQQSCKTILHSQVMPVIRGILGNQDDFLDAQVL